MLYGTQNNFILFFLAKEKNLCSRTASVSYIYVDHIFEIVVVASRRRTAIFI